MRILFVGPVHAEKRYYDQKTEERRRYGSIINEFPFGSGQYHMVKALKKLKYKVDVFYSTQSVLINEYSTRALYSSLPNFPVKAFLHGLIYKNVPLQFSLDMRLRNLRLLEKAREFDYDLILVSCGNLVLPSTIKELKKSAPIGLLYGATPVYFTRNIRVCAKFYDCIFVNALVTKRELKRYNGNVKWLPIAACDPDIHNKIDLSEEDTYFYGNDVCFVGRPYTHRETILKTVADFNLGLWGVGWGKLKTQKKWIENCYRGAAFVEKWVKIYNASKISLNIFGSGDTSGINMRLFEASACGILQIAEYRSNIEKFFEIDEEIVCFKTIGELKRLIKYYLKHPEERLHIAENGKKRAHSCHTYEERMKEIIFSLENSF